MRIPIDYDEVPLHVIRTDLKRICNLHRISPIIEIIQTNPKRYTAILITDILMDEAINIIQSANCDPDYKKFVKSRRELTERVTRKNFTGPFPSRVSVFPHISDTSSHPNP